MELSAIPVPQDFMTPTGDRFTLGADGHRAMIGSEEGTMVRFFEKPYKLEAASIEAKLPIFESRTFVEIKCKFDPKNVHIHMLRKGDLEDEWKVRFQREWELYLRAKQHASQGTPILQWSEIPQATAATLDELGIITLEHLLATDDLVLAKIFKSPKEIKEAALAQLSYKNKVGEITEVTKRLVDTAGKLDTANDLIEKLEKEKEILNASLRAVKGTVIKSSANAAAKEYLAKVHAEKRVAPQPVEEPPVKSDGIIISGD